MYELSSGLMPVEWIGQRVTTDLLQPLLFFSQAVVLSSQPFQVQAGQPGSILQALLNPLLHADGDVKSHKVNQRGPAFRTLSPPCGGTTADEYARTHSVTVVRSSLSLRFCSSRYASFSRRCKRAVSRPTSNSCVFSWS